jgi:hypothetical protein
LTFFTLSPIVASYIAYPETAVSIKSLFIIGTTLLASTAFAQTALGTVGNVQGLVTDTDGASVSSTLPGEAIVDGKRFVTSSSGSVTLQLNNGCTLTLQPNQAVTIDSRMTCRELMASVTPVGAPTLAGGGAGGSAAMGALGIGALAVGGFALHRTLDKNPSLSGQ